MKVKVTFDIGEEMRIALARRIRRYDRGDRPATKEEIISDINRRIGEDYSKCLEEYREVEARKCLRKKFVTP